MPLGVGGGQYVGFRDFCHILTLLPPGASVFLKHMSSSCVALIFYAADDTIYKFRKSAFVVREITCRPII